MSIDIARRLETFPLPKLLMKSTDFTVNWLFITLFEILLIHIIHVQVTEDFSYRKMAKLCEQHELQDSSCPTRIFLIFILTTSLLCALSFDSHQRAETNNV